MPIYEYSCPKCGQFELMRRITDPALKKCPTCKRAVKKLISNSSFQLKGSGWYITDYARKSGGGDSGAKADSSGDGGGSSDSTASSDTKAKAPSKPAAKSESKSSKSTKSGDSGKTSAAA